MIRPVTLLWASCAAAILLGSLGLVTWRQSRALESLEDLDGVRRLVSVNEAERLDIVREIEVMESRARIVPRAEAELGMHTPDATEMVFLSGALSS